MDGSTRRHYRQLSSRAIEVGHDGRRIWGVAVHLWEMVDLMVVEWLFHKVNNDWEWLMMLNTGCFDGC